MFHTSNKETSQIISFLNEKKRFADFLPHLPTSAERVNRFTSSTFKSTFHSKVTDSPSEDLLETADFSDCGITKERIRDRHWAQMSDIST